MSRYLPDSRSLFLHIPKTGGKSVENLLSQCGIASKYATIRQNYWGPSRWRVSRTHCYPWMYRNDETQPIERIFAFVRHPIAWYESRWRYMWDSPGHRKRGRVPCWEVAALFDEDFNVWMERVLVHQPAYVTRLYERYLGPIGGEVVHYVGRTENLIADAVTILRLIGYTVPLDIAAERRNASTKREIVWSMELKSKILAVERATMDRFYPFSETWPLPVIINEGTIP